MLSVKTILLSGVVAASGLFLNGCQADTKPPQSALVSSAEGLTCSKCKITWVKSPVRGDKVWITRYETRKSMECPDCKDAVTNFFATGRLEHTCKTCGDSMEICKAH